MRGGSNPQPRKSAISQGKDGGKMYFCRANYWTKELLLPKKEKRSKTQISRSATPDPPKID